MNFHISDVKEYVIKAQILAGGRGKGHFDNGFKGGVHITNNRNDIDKIVQKMLGHKLITKQTPKEGILVNKIMIAESVNIVRETYVCILMDRQRNGPVIIASPAGGVDIEAVAEKTPHLLKTVPIDIFEGVTDKIADELADFLEFRGDLRGKASTEIKKLWGLFVAVDATQLEINPLVETDTNQVISVDAKLNFDDNAKFRQKDVFSMEDVTESDPREVEASKYNLNYIGMNGNIGCLVNGAGLAMATMDIIKLHGGDPANFLDVGGGVKEDQVRAAFRIITSDTKVKSVLVNVFGGIVNCATIANGIVGALKTMTLKIPLIVRLEGTNAIEARKIIKESGLNIITAENLEEAAQKAVVST
nr:succinate--CoA ligase [GDP-forming] subunit beta, mitochondrial [Leptinotarsa decemlineata]